MVLLTMTAMVVEALEEIQGPGRVDQKKGIHDEDAATEGTGNKDEKCADETMENPTRERIEKDTMPRVSSTDSEKMLEDRKSAEPSLLNPHIGNPISHGQILYLSQDIKTRGQHLGRLEDLLKGARVYVPPPPPKPEPVSILLSFVRFGGRETELSRHCVL